MNEFIDTCGAHEYLQLLCDGLTWLASAKEEAVTVGFAVLISFLLVIWKIKSYTNNRGDIKRSRNLQRRLLCESFSDRDFEAAIQNYIPPYGTNIDPSDADDLISPLGVKQPIMDVINGEINNVRGKRHILVLADSGMGKTTFLLNFTVNRVNKDKRIALVSLSRGSSIDQISKIEFKKDTILLLDAFDEDTEAITRPEDRLSEIVKAAQDFSTVIMTCRTQFFIQDSAIPRSTGLLKVGSRGAGISQYHEWRTVYLLPFNDVQVSEFIDLAIPFYKRKTRSIAKELAKKIPDLAARPMLLNLIPEIASNEARIDNLWQLYEFMVKQWAIRENDWISKDELISFSKALAFEIYSKRDQRKSERVHIEELNSIFNKDFTKANKEASKFRTRSLLNRDSEGNYKFAHRSIMEYFFILDFIDGNDKAVDFKWTDMMCELFISWGHTDYTNKAREQKIFALNFVKTSLFPFLPKTHSFSTINEAWIKSIFNDNTNANSYFPVRWRSYTSKIINVREQNQVYDFAAGNVYQFLDTTGFPNSELKTYLINRSLTSWVEGSGAQWKSPSLFEIKTFLEILAANNSLHKLDDRVPYWLNDTDSSKVSTLFKISFYGKAVASENISGGIQRRTKFSMSHLNKLGSTQITIGNYFIGIEILTGNLTRLPLSAVEAIGIHVHHGDALKIWSNDSINGSTLFWRLPNQ
jgi:hypothetical protein